MKSNLWKKGIILGTIILFVGTSILPNAIGLSHLFNETQYDINRIPNSENLGQNNPPIIEDPSPENGAIVNLSISELHVLIEDPDEDEIDWTIKTSPNIGNQSGTVQGKGRVYCSIYDLKYSTQYFWFVNVTDGELWTNRTYHFTTEDNVDIPTVAKTVVWGEPRDKVSFISDAGEHLKHIYNWTGSEHQVKIQWEVTNDYEETSETITFYYRIREWQADLSFPLPFLMLYCLEGGRIRTPQYEGFASFIEIPIVVSPEPGYSDSGEVIIDIIINNPYGDVEMCCFISRYPFPIGIMKHTITTTIIHF